MKTYILADFEMCITGISLPSRRSDKLEQKHRVPDTYYTNNDYTKRYKRL